MQPPARNEVGARGAAVNVGSVQCPDDGAEAVEAAVLVAGGRGVADGERLLAAGIVVRVVARRAVEAVARVLPGALAHLHGRLRVVLRRTGGVAAVRLEARLDPALLGLPAPVRGLLPVVAV